MDCWETSRMFRDNLNMQSSHAFVHHCRPTFLAEMLLLSGFAVLAVRQPFLGLVLPFHTVRHGHLKV